MKSYLTKPLQRGATLIEVLVTMLVVAVGLFGVAGLQLVSVKSQQTSTLRTQALVQSDWLVEKMRVNNSLLTAANLAVAVATPEQAYLAPEEYDAADTLPDDPACGLNGQPACTAALAAQRDLREWRLSLARELPGGRGSIFQVVSGGVAEPNTRRVVVMWREKAQSETANVAGLAAVEFTDPECPPPRTAGVRCLNVWVAP